MSESTKTIWVTGASGMLGTDLCGRLAELGVPFVGTGRNVDITDAAQIGEFALEKNIGWILNCAAYTAVDKAEDEPQEAYALNAEGPLLLARWCAANDAKLIHISTDYVFDGTATAPYTEDLSTNPLGVYGSTKEAGERNISTVLDQHFILRTAWLYGLNGPNFIKTMLRLMRERDEIGVVVDQYGAPTWTADLANTIVEIVQNGSQEYGTYHASGEGETNWHEFANLVAECGVEKGLLAKVPTINKLSTAQYPTKAQRPAWSVLSKKKLHATFGICFPQWESSVKTFLETYKKIL